MNRIRVNPGLVTVTFVIFFVILSGLILLSSITITGITSFNKYVQKPKGFKLHKNLSDFSTVYNENSIPFTNLDESMSKLGRDFWDSHKGKLKFNCPAKLLYRVGSKKYDGGKWVCGLETLGKRNVQDGYSCTVYSFGVNGESSFEADILQTTFCSIYAFDPFVRSIGIPLSKFHNPRVKFQKLGINGNNTKGMKTLKTLMTENGHTFIDILKIDVEGAEYDSFDRIFEDFEDQLPFGQLLMELHINDKLDKWNDEKKRRPIELIRNLEKRGLRAFSVEPNPVPIARDCCSEFSFINMHYLKLFISVESENQVQS